MDKQGTPLTLQSVMTSLNWTLMTGVTNFVNNNPANNVFINVEIYERTMTIMSDATLHGDNDPYPIVVDVWIENAKLSAYVSPSSPQHFPSSK
mmetsp:Transcript_63030/g.153524  ORF Transcript_63030/g.153524 Transcript_63030/m.153524 type:complete len:93 (+) Transcript_63030:560-838(+)